MVAAEHELRELRPEEVAARAVLTALATDETGAWSAIDPLVAIKACTIVIAGIVETIPASASTKGMRLSVEEVTTGLKREIRSMRETFEKTGLHGLEQNRRAHFH